MLQGMMGDVSKIYGNSKTIYKNIYSFITKGLDPSTQHRRQLPTLELQRPLVISLLILASLTALMVIFRWFVGLYFAILFDQMYHRGSMLDDYVEFAASLAQLLLFSTVFIYY